MQDISPEKQINKCNTKNNTTMSDTEGKKLNKQVKKEFLEKK